MSRFQTPSGLKLAKAKLDDMEIIPVINCEDEMCVEKRFKIINDLGSAWVHIDVTDGKFAPAKALGDQTELKKLLTAHHLPQLNIELHLMVENLEEVICDWLEISLSRIIVHAETIEDFDFIEGKCDGGGIEVGVSIKCDSPTDLLVPYVSHGVRFFHVLAVGPGFSGQKFNDLAIGKIEFLRTADKDIIIEVDGGINPETAKLVKNVGANILVSDSYIFNSTSPSGAYEELIRI